MELAYSPWDPDKIRVADVRGERGGRGRGRGRGRGGGRGGERGTNESEDDLYFGDPADEEKVAQKLGPEVMSQLTEGLEEMKSRVLPSPYDDAPLDALDNELPLNLEVGPISMTKRQLFLQIDQSFQIHRSYGSMLEGEADELKRVFLEGNPYLLGITMIVSVFHSLFDFLAFKNGDNPLNLVSMIRL